MSENYRLYMKDFCLWLREQAVEAKRKKNAAELTDGKEAEAYELEAGRSQAYLEVISHIQNEAEGFGLDLKELHLDSFDPYAL